MLPDMLRDALYAENITQHHQNITRELFKLQEHLWILYLWILLVNFTLLVHKVTNIPLQSFVCCQAGPSAYLYQIRQHLL